MRKNLYPAAFVLLLLWIFPQFLDAQAGRQGFWNDPLQARSFVQNQGQFDARLKGEPVNFGFEGNGHHVFLGNGKIYYQLYRIEHKKKTEEDKKKRYLQKINGFASQEAFTAFAEAGDRIIFHSDLLVAEWVGANPNMELVPSDKDNFTHSYEYREGNKFKTREGISSWKKVTYRNLYDHIDVEYELHPQSGVKYTLILHPGADISQVRLRYSKLPELKNDGRIVTPTRLGEVVDHPPFTFYQNSNQEIVSGYALQDHDITFKLSGYDASQTVVIDPWTNLPNDPGSNWNSAWECETDALGNAYAIFGAMPLQLRKYNAAGAIQWTYNTTYDTTSWLGTFVTDDAGNSFVTNGSTAALRRVNTAGGLVWSVGNITGQLLGEFWNIAFNCDQTRLITGGTGGLFVPEPYIYEVNMVNGALLGSVLVHQGTGLFSPSEVRAITATENAKYYWLTHDSIGFLSQSFASCPASGSSLIVNNGYDLGYKCENWRVNNTGIEAMAYFGGFIYVNRGNRIDKRNVNTGAIVATAAIPAGTFTSGFGGSQVENSGIIIDNTGRIFVGSKGSVSQFDVNLNLVATFPVTGGYTVYDVDLTSSGQLIACGSTGNSGSASRTGTVESLGVIGSAPYVMPCCDASICAVGPFCDTDGPVNLTPGVAGGTWSSTAPGFNAVTGTFDPSVAGIGTYTFHYTQPCGSDSLVVDVQFCPTLTVCRLGNGDLSVTGGTAPYNWETGTIVHSCPFGPGSGCNFLTHSVATLTWTNFATGNIVTPPAGADTVHVFDPSNELFSWDITTLPSCVVLPAEMVTFEGKSVDEHTNALHWVTSSETDLDHFTLQSSPNGTDWKAIATVRGKGSLNQETRYDFTDGAAYAPVTFYKLGLTDHNGMYRHLYTIEINSQTHENLINHVYPNPARDVIHFTYTGSAQENQPLFVKLVNTLGSVTQTRVYTGMGQIEDLSMEVSGLAAGVYFLYFRQGSRTAYRKIVVQGG
ncbi:MAG: T9SS type A sorting domain-containing protein [Bacteroidia bacterium]|nr:T9SS type A sorting domain-containing protein [Bacteroidia bacterium]